MGEEGERWHDGTKGDPAKMFGPCFRPVVNFVPLQAADIFGVETYAYGRGWLGRSRRNDKPAFTSSWIESERFTACFMDAGKIGEKPSKGLFLDT